MAHWGQETEPLTETPISILIQASYAFKSNLQYKANIICVCTVKRTETSLKIERIATRDNNDGY